MVESSVLIEEHIRDIQDITIAIDSWDDIFSDFDPSPLEQRILSEDFLVELKKRYRETQRGNFIITIYAPMSLRDDVSEKIVIKRLKQYFKFRHLSVQKEMNESVGKGLIFVIVGILLLAALTLAAYFKKLSTLSLELAGIIMMPLGWFGIWEGFSRIIEPSELGKQDLGLFAKLSKASYKFKYAGQISAENSAGGGV
jgi:hypothetical protein